MRLHALQTGVVHVRPTFLRGSVAAGGPLGFLAQLQLDHRPWIDLPIYAWVIEHEEGVIVVDTGDRADTGSNFISRSTYTISPDDQIGAHLARLGLAAHDVSKVVLTHLHGDHVNGLRDLKDVPVYLGEHEYAFYRSRFGGVFTRRTTRVPAWFDPQPLVYQARPLGPFPRSAALTAAGDVIAVPTPGHTGGHLSVVVVADGVSYFLAGDVTYDQQGLLAQQLQGPSLAPRAHVQTLQRVLQFAHGQPTVYLPSHDAQTGARVAARQVVRSDPAPRVVAENRIRA